VELWRPVKTPLFITSLKVAETLKYADNVFHGLKVAFANEFGAICKSLGIDSHEVMRIFVADTKLNISPLYRKPGFAFGGPCLPKDLRALYSTAQDAGLEIPVFSSILTSNDRHLQRAMELILATGRKKIAVLCLVFKSDTDDLRESPACTLVKHLLEAGKQVRVFDPRVEPSRLIGTSRAFIEGALPELPTLLTKSPADLLRWSEAVVLAGQHPESAALAARMQRRHILIDLVRLPSAYNRGRRVSKASAGDQGGAARASVLTSGLRTRKAALNSAGWLCNVHFSHRGRLGAAQSRAQKKLQKTA